MSNQLVYEFEEIRPFPGLDVWAHGDAYIDYWKDGDDFDWRIDEIDIGDGWLGANHPLWEPIVKALGKGDEMDAINALVHEHIQEAA